MHPEVKWWRVAYRVLFAVWAFDAILVMNKVRGGFFTSYAADRTLPAFLYIATRELRQPRHKLWIATWFGAKPELAAAVILAGSTLTEISQLYWPRGPFAGRFDPYDILANFAGVGTCFAVDRLRLSARETLERLGSPIYFVKSLMG